MFTKLVPSVIRGGMSVHVPDAAMRGLLQLGHGEYGVECFRTSALVLALALALALPSSSTAASAGHRTEFLFPLSDQPSHPKR
ncbi:Protein of unknown function [Gryllus bimaculatus]|nr:Protein of unknown function [Gryllus bimaculatus]